MQIKGSTLRETAATFETLAKQLATLPPNTERIETCEDLLETAREFSQMSDGVLDLSGFNSDDREIFLKNIEALAAIARAGGNSERRSTPILKDLGDVADQLNLGRRCSEIATQFTRILVDI